MGERKYRILSIDGGGIYGLASSIWLRELCQRDPDFLTGEDIHLFAGISAGALISLLLAKYDRPREAVLDGVLDNFWAERIGVFSNVVDPVASFWSLFGIGGWLGEADFRQQLERHFDDMRLDQLKQKVLITTFDWNGDPPEKEAKWKPKVHNPWLHWWTHSPASPWSGNTIAPPGPSRGWGPRIFTNLRVPDGMVTETDAHARVVDVAYGAAAPPGLRAVREGVSDAGIFAVSPALQALTAVVFLSETVHLAAMPKVQEMSQLISTQTYEKMQELWKEMSALLHPLEHISMLSVGNGSLVPSFWLSDFNMSALQMALVPTDPRRNQWSAPTQRAMFDGITEDVDRSCKKLLRERFFRLSPPIFEFPVLAAAGLSRFPQWKQYFMRTIREKTKGRESMDVVRNAVTFLDGPEWGNPAELPVERPLVAV